MNTHLCLSVSYHASFVSKAVFLLVFISSLIFVISLLGTLNTAIPSSLFLIKYFFHSYFDCSCNEVLNVITSQQQSACHKRMIWTSVALPTAVGTVIDLDTPKQTLTEILFQKNRLVVWLSSLRSQKRFGRTHIYVCQSHIMQVLFQKLFFD